MIEIITRLKAEIFRFLSLIKQARDIRNNCEIDRHDHLGSLSVLSNFPSFRVDQKPKEIIHLLELIEKYDMKSICEIGAHRGGSLSLFCKAAPEKATIISIDIDYPIKRQIANKFLSYQKQRVACIRGDSRDFRTIRSVKRVLRGKKLDLLFIDGDHSFLGVTSDFSLYSTLVKDGGVIAFHDIQPISDSHSQERCDAYVGGVPQFWYAIKNVYDQTEEIIDDPNQEGYGIGILFNV